jgi:hypothetical protein
MLKKIIKFSSTGRHKAATDWADRLALEQAEGR